MVLLFQSELRDRREARDREATFCQERRRIISGHAEHANLAAGSKRRSTPAGSNSGKLTRTQALRREYILDVAQAEFLANGFEKTSMAAISNRAGGSKATIYSYFPSKEALFLAVVERHKSQSNILFTELLEQERSCRASLIAWGEAFLQLVHSDQSVRFFRVICAECENYPDIAQSLYAQSRQTTHRTLAAFLQRQIARGALTQSDPNLAADQLIALCQARTQRARLLNVVPAPLPAEITHDVEAAVDIFLSAYSQLSPQFFT